MSDTLPVFDSGVRHSNHELLCGRCRYVIYATPRSDRLLLHEKLVLQSRLAGFASEGRQHFRVFPEPIPACTESELVTDVNFPRTTGRKRHCPQCGSEYGYQLLSALDENYVGFVFSPADVTLMTEHARDDQDFVDLCVDVDKPTASCLDEFDEQDLDDIAQMLVDEERKRLVEEKEAAHMLQLELADAEMAGENLALENRGGDVGAGVQACVVGSDCRDDGWVDGSGGHGGDDQVSDNGWGGDWGDESDEDWDGVIGMLDASVERYSVGRLCP